MANGVVAAAEADCCARCRHRAWLQQKITSFLARPSVCPFVRPSVGCRAAQLLLVRRPPVCPSFHAGSPNNNNNDKDSIAKPYFALLQKTDFWHQHLIHKVLLFVNPNSVRCLGMGNRTINPRSLCNALRTCPASLSVGPRTSALARPLARALQSLLPSCTNVAAARCVHPSSFRYCCCLLPGRRRRRRRRRRNSPFGGQPALRATKNFLLLLLLPQADENNELLLMSAELVSVCAWPTTSAAAAAAAMVQGAAA
jgi:hypothetical protein